MEKLKGGQRSSKFPGKVLRANAHGFEGVGKSTFALTFPPPLFVINCDRDLSSLLEQLPEHYDINYEHIVLDVDMTKAIAARYLMLFDGVVNAAVKAGEGTLIWDGFDLAWELVQLAKLPQGGESFQFEYADANSYMNTKMRRLAAKPLNLCFTAMSKELYSSGGEPTGKFISAGYKHRGRWITEEIRLFTGDANPGAVPVALANPGVEHKSYVQKSKTNEKLVGKVLPNLSYKTLFKLVYAELPPNHEKLWSPA